MASSRSTLQWLCSLLFLVTAATALKFELRAHGGHESHSKERCIRNFVNKDTLVVVKSAVGGFKGDGMVINIAVRDTLGNEYGRARDVVGESKQVFTSHEDAAFDVCYENLFDSNSRNSGGGQRDIELDVDIGADAKDWDSIKADEKLKPVEADLRRIEELTGEIVTEMEYLRTREQKLRDTNESTNTRVKWFGVMTTWLLVGLWAWQILYLRAYFRSKHLI